MALSKTYTFPVVRECDVLVAGGGFAGISAALAAARQKKKVILLERSFMLGGLGTAGLITMYLPLCDGLGHQVSFSLAEELARLAADKACERSRAANWLDSSDPAKRTENDPRFVVGYNPSLFAVAAEQLLLKNGVTVLYGFTAADVLTEGDRITHVITQSKSGFGAIAARSFVDATGDADLVHFTGTPEATFRQGNILAAWYYKYSKTAGYDLQVLGVCDLPDDQKKNGQGVPQLSARRFTGVDAFEISEYTVLSHEQMMNHVFRGREDDPTLIPVTMPTVPQLRMTRRLVGEYELDDREMHKRFDDSVGMVSDWRKRGPVYEVPFRTLYSGKCKNLICAGRLTSVTESMWDIMRVIPDCAVTGQAAGTAAALSDDFAKLNVRELQQALEQSGVRLHEYF